MKMQIYFYPAKDTWNELVKRPALQNEKISDTVQAIISDVKLRGDEALFEYAEQFDNCKLNSLKLPPERIRNAGAELDGPLKEAMALAAANIRSFHAQQFEAVRITDTMPGVRCWRKSIPVQKVGLYIPGGTAPLFSSLLMLGIPATLAGCPEIVICTPPDQNGDVAPTIRYAASMLGLENIFTIGGAQAIAAMAYGTKSIPAVDKIFGPGNQWVTTAKQLVQQHGTAIDMPAGPSEVLVLADARSNAAFAAADLLSQAEHGIDSQVILVLSEERGEVKTFIDEIQLHISSQLLLLSRKNIAEESLKSSKIIVSKTDAEAMAFSNHYAPEHLIITTENTDKLAELVTQAGSVFLGPWSCESAGDYASGTNHTLPTNGFARSYSGVSLDSFVKKVTFQEISREGITAIGPAIELLAEAEGLDAHKNAASIRLNTIQNG
jgi:histidinol dehydrogenase